MKWTALITGDEDTDTSAAAVLCLADYIMQGWTVAQWEAVRWALLGFKRKEMARKLKIAHQNVTKRILAAGWLHIDIALGSLATLIAKTAGTRIAVQTVAAPK